MWDTLGKILVGALVIGAAAAIVYMTLDTIRNWLSNNIRNDSKCVVVMREALQNGNYGVIAGVLNYDDQVTASNSWSNVEMDSNLDELFDGRDAVVLTV